MDPTPFYVANTLQAMDDDSGGLWLYPQKKMYCRTQFACFTKHTLFQCVHIHTHPPTHSLFTTPTKSHTYTQGQQQPTLDVDTITTTINIDAFAAWGLFSLFLSLAVSLRLCISIIWIWEKHTFHANFLF